MKTKRLAFSLLAATMLLASGTASAAFLSGQVAMVYQAGANHYVYIKPSGFYAVPSYVWFAYTSDSRVAATLSSSLGKNVIMGTNANCSTSGSYRGCGTVTYAYVQ